MKKIKLTQNKISLIDDKDFEKVSRFKWYAYKNQSGNWYARNRKSLYMHRLIMGFPENNYVDHIDRNGLNNCRNNLRVSNNHLNQLNRKLNSNNTSGYKGVLWSKKENKWKSQIYLHGKSKHLGYYKNKSDAIKVRKNYENKYLGTGYLKRKL